MERAAQLALEALGGWESLRLFMEAESYSCGPINQSINPENRYISIKILYGDGEMLKLLINTECHRVVCVDSGYYQESCVLSLHNEFDRMRLIKIVENLTSVPLTF